MRKIISYLLVATIAVSLLAACGAKKEETKDVSSQSESSSDESGENEKEQKEATGTISLNKIGSFADEDLKVKIYNGGLLLEEDEVTILDYLGNDNLGKTYTNATCLRDGYWSVHDKSDDINSCGLVNIDGTELIPCEATWIGNEMWTQASINEPRFVAVYYSTGVTENKDEALFYSTDSVVDFLGSSLNENSVLYTGYAKIFDLEAESFVEGIEITVDNWDIYACGDSIIEIKDGTTYLYDSSGKLIDEFVKISSTDIDSVNGYFVVESDSTSVLYDCQGNEIMRSSTDEYRYNVYTSEDTSEYIDVSKDNKYGASDLNGNLVLPIEFDSVYTIYNGYASVRSDNSEYKLICLETGEQVGPTVNSSEYKYLEYGYWYTRNEDDKYIYIDSLGEVHESLEYAPDLNIRNDENGEGYRYYIWGNKEYSAEYKSANSLATGLVWVLNEEGLKGVVETFTGSMILDYEYSRLTAQDGYVYAYKDGVYDVYEIVNE